MKPSKITIENAQLIFRNFSGKEGKFYPAGSRNFCVILEDEATVQQMISDGWNIKYLQPRDEGDLPTAYLKVKVTYGKVAPSIYLVTGKHKTLLNEDDIGALDWADILNADLQIRPYKWEMGNNSGIAAYLDVLYATIEENKLESKYSFSDEESALNSVQSSSLTTDQLPF